MSRSIPLSFALCLLFSPLCMADQVVREVPDTTAGKGFGALIGLMVGDSLWPILLKKSALPDCPRTDC